MSEIPSERYFRKVDLGQNMRRFYALDMQPTLFGEWCAIQTWGRIGSKGRQKFTYFDNARDAQGFIQAETLRRHKRSYALQAPGVTAI